MQPTILKLLRTLKTFYTHSCMRLSVFSTVINLIYKFIHFIFIKIGKGHLILRLHFVPVPSKSFSFANRDLEVETGERELVDHQGQGGRQDEEAHQGGEDHLDVGDPLDAEDHLDGVVQALVLEGQAC